MFVMILSMTQVSVIHAMQTDHEYYQKLPIKFVDLGVFNDDDESCAHAISGNGKVVVGWVKSGSSNDEVKAFRWAQETGMQPLDSLNNGGKGAAIWARAVNTDGNVIVGDVENTENGRIKSFCWTADSGMQFLDVFNTGRKWVQAISANGRETIGWERENLSSADNTIKIFHWTQEEGIQFLDSLNVGANTFISALSVNGKTAVGWVKENDEENRIFHWTQEEGIQFPDSLNVGENTFASALSVKGDVVVGNTTENGITIPFRWTHETGIQSIPELLKIANKLPEDWNLTIAHGVSGDGTIVVGVGEYRGKQRAWLANMGSPY